LTCKYIPAGGASQFSVNVGLPPEKTRDIGRVKVFDVKTLGDKDVCIPAEEGLQRTIVGEAILVHGVARNSADFTIREAWITCDFYDTQWVYLGTAKGELTGTKELAPGKSAPFEVRFVPEMVANVAYYTPRLVGKKAK